MQQRSKSPVRDLREAAGLTQFRLAILARCSLATVSRAEAGFGTTATFAALGRVLGVDGWKLKQQVEAEKEKIASQFEQAGAHP